MKNFKINFENVGCRYSIRQGHLRASYHDALRDVTFSLSQGERLGIIGMNGAGKSTLLRIFAKVLYPTSGRVARKGNPRCSLLSLASHWYPDLSGRDNAVLALLMGGLRRKEAEKRLEEIADFSELGDWIDRPVRTYSSGMGSRLALAAALQISPDVLLMDETLSVGDAVFQRKAFEAVMNMVKRAGSVVLVAHDLAAVSTICERLLWLENGRVRQDGPTEEVLENYRDWVEQNQQMRGLFGV